MDRRAFLSGLLGAVAGAALDPEKLLWRPTKTIFIPPARTQFLTTSMVMPMALRQLRNNLLFISQQGIFETDGREVIRIGETVNVRKPPRSIVYG